MEHQRHDKVEKTNNEPEKNIHFVYHKSHMDLPGSKPNLRLERSATNSIRQETKERDLMEVGRNAVRLSDRSNSDQFCTSVSHVVQYK